MEETLLALSLGLSGGISPGPMLVLVLTQTIQYGLKEGLKVTLGPLISDAPIIIAAYYFTNQIPVNLLDWLYLPGGLYLIYIAKHSWAIDFDSMDVQKPVANSIRKGVVTNVLNPAPYLFWLTIGAPIIIKILPYPFLEHGLPRKSKRHRSMVGVICGCGNHTSLHIQTRTL